jgi:hypothetical protein
MDIDNKEPSNRNPEIWSIRVVRIDLSKVPNRVVDVSRGFPRQSGHDF